MQKKFLRFLETRRFRRVGDTREIQVNARIILATNMDLHKATQKGEIRKDLLYRMDVISIRIPSLRERPEDIPLLAAHFLNTHPDKTFDAGIAEDTLDALVHYSWPGNVRELKSLINKLLILSDSPVIHSRHLPAYMRASAPAALTDAPRSLEEMEKAHIIKVLEVTGGRQNSAAEILGINRKTLYKKIHRYGIFA